MSNKKNIMDKIKASFSGRKFKSGAYASIISVIVIVIILVINLIVSKMEIEIDLTANSKFSITAETKDVLKELKDDITIYYIVQQGDELEEIEKIAKQYERYSNKVTLVYKDPVLYPQFGSDLVDEEITQNSFIVVNNSNNRAKYVDYDDMIVQEFDYSYFTYKTTGIDTEGELTSAILYVTSEELPNVYVVQGHQETEIPETFSESLKKMNVNVQTISTLQVESIPEDCDLLYINAPKIDLNDNEYNMIKDYLAAGGNVVITVDYRAYDLKNVQSILEYYGINMVEGVILEGNINQMMPNYPNLLFPNIESHEITSKAAGSAVLALMPNASGLKTVETKRSTLTITPLLSTSDKAFSKVRLPIQSIAKENGDIDGPFYLGLLSTDNFKGVTSNLVVFSSELTFGEETSQYANGYLLTGTAGYLLGDTKSSVSIPEKSYGYSYIYPPTKQAIIWGIATVLGIPLVIFFAGAVVCLRRRKK